MTATISERQAKQVLDAMSVVAVVDGMGTAELRLQLDTGQDVFFTAAGGVVNVLRPANAVELLRRANAITDVRGLGTGLVRLYTYDGHWVNLDGFTGFFQAGTDDNYVEGGAYYAEGEGTAELVTHLAGANNDVKFVANVPGTGGNGLSVVYVNPGGNNQPLNIQRLSTVVTVSLATGPGGAITTTAQQIVDEVVSQGPITLSVYARIADDNPNGSGVVTAMAETPLAGGV